MANTPTNNHAFFDLDKTLTRDFTLHQFGFFLQQKGLISDWFQHQEKILTHKFNTGQIKYRQAGQLINQIFATAIKGLSLSDLTPALDEFIQQPTFFQSWVKPTLRLLNRHHFQTHLISGSSLPIVRAVARHLEFDSFSASIPELDKNNTYTGNVLSIMDFEAKLAVMDSILSAYPPTNLVIGFGDSNGDVPMLSRTHLAFLIKPTHPQLKKTAQKNGWHITGDAQQIAAIIKKHL